MGTKILNIAKDFSRCPGARYRKEGEFSGEEFREDYLIPRLEEALTNGDILLIDLDGSSGYSTSFIEESFGGLIRNNKYTLQQLNEVLDFKSDEDPSYIEDIKDYLKHAWENR